MGCVAAPQAASGDPLEILFDVARAYVDEERPETSPACIIGLNECRSRAQRRLDRKRDSARNVVRDKCLAFGLGLRPSVRGDPYIRTMNHGCTVIYVEASWSSPGLVDTFQSNRQRDPHRGGVTHGSTQTT